MDKITLWQHLDETRGRIWWYSLDTDLVAQLSTEMQVSGYYIIAIYSAVCCIHFLVQNYIQVMLYDHQLGQVYQQESRFSLYIIYALPGLIQMQLLYVARFLLWLPSEQCKIYSDLQMATLGKLEMLAMLKLQTFVSYITFIS